MPRQPHKVQSLTAPLSSGSQAFCLPALRKRDAWDTNQQPLRFAHLPEMREQGGRATLLGATEHSGYRLCFRTLAGLAKFCQTDPLSIVTKGFAITQQLSPEWCIEESVLACTGSATEHVTNSRAHVPRLCFRSVESCRYKKAERYNTYI